jgi:Fe-S-cluster-containing hydrogenase component 2
MPKEIVIDISKCTGCGYCELICSFTHHDEFNPCKSRIRVNTFIEKSIAVPVVCFQCEDPWCVNACPAGALNIEVDANAGIRMITVDKLQCVGCKMCTLACPFGCIEVTDGQAEKCNLCGGTPQCVRVCRAGALQFIDPKIAVTAKKKSVAERLVNSYREA